MCTSFTFPHLCTGGAPRTQTSRNICTYKRTGLWLKAQSGVIATSENIRSRLKILSEQCEIRCITVNMVQVHRKCSACVTEQQKLGKEEAAAKCLEFSGFSSVNVNGYGVGVEGFSGRSTDCSAQWWQPWEGMQYYRKVEEGLNVNNQGRA